MLFLNRHIQFYVRFYIWHSKCQSPHCLSAYIRRMFGGYIHSLIGIALSLSLFPIQLPWTSPVTLTTLERRAEQSYLRVQLFGGKGRRMAAKVQPSFHTFMTRRTL